MRLHIEIAGPGCPLDAETLCSFEAPDELVLEELLGLVGMKTEQIMLAFVNGQLATLPTSLHDGDRVNLCVFICGG